MKKQIIKVNEDGSEVAKNHGTWVLTPNKDTEKPMGYLINHCRPHANVKVETFC